MSDEKSVDQINEDLDQQYRKIALVLKTRLKEWFTNSQIINIYGKEQAPEIIQTLEYLGLLKSESAHGAWKHRIIENPAEREILIRSNLAALRVQQSGVIENINILEQILEKVIADA